MWKFEIENIAGIRNGSATINDGLNVVQASNFKGKSSLIAAIQTVMGGSGQYEDHPLTEGAESGCITLQTSEETYEVTLERNRTGASRSGSCYLVDETEQKTARLFAFLGDTNPIRTAVRNEENLTEYLQEPLNIGEIDAEIEGLRNERKQVESQLENAEQAVDRLPKVQAQVTQLETELGELREQKDEVEGASEARKKATELSDELSERRTELKDAERQVQRLETDIENKQEQIEAKQQRLDELEVPEVPTLSDLDRKQDRLDELDSHISLLEQLHRANENVLESAVLDRLTTVERSLAGDEIECWVCGEVVPKENIEEQIDSINDCVSDLKDERKELADEIDEFETRKREAEQKQRQRETLEEAVKTLQQTIDEREADLRQARARRDELEPKVEQLEEELSAVEEDYSDELTDLKTEIRSKERQLEKQQDELVDIKERKYEREHLREKADDLSNQIEDLRKRKNETQRQLAEEFQSAINDIIDRFSPGFETARFDLITNEQGEVEDFELIIARQGRETTVGALSEGEVELIGVAVALAGYRVYDVDELVPCILIDGISQLASEHLRDLIEYLEDTVDILVTTAYPEFGDVDGQTITPDAWDVVSDQETTTAD